MSEIATRQDPADLEKRFTLALDNLALRIMISLGGFVAACIAALGVFLKLTT